MEESTKKRIHEIEIGVAVVLILVSVISFFPKPGITGHVSYETKTYKINLTIANSQSHILTTNSQKPFVVTSLKFSGEVIGDGIAKIYIDSNNDQRILSYSNVIKKGKGMGSITGMDKITGGAIGVDSETEEEQLVIAYLENIEVELEDMGKDESLVGGIFENVCIDSCFIEMLLNKDSSYQLLFYVEDGTILKINEIVYTIKKD